MANEIVFIPNLLLEKEWELSPTAAGIVTAKGKLVEEKAKQLAPVDTGALVSSITSHFEFIDGHPGSTISADVPYAAYVEVGTSDTPAQPFLRPALEGGD